MRAPDFDSVSLHSSKFVGGEGSLDCKWNKSQERTLEAVKGGRAESKGCFLTWRKIDAANAEEEEEVLHFTFIVCGAGWET